MTDNTNYDALRAQVLDSWVNIPAGVEINRTAIVDIGKRLAAIHADIAVATMRELNADTNIQQLLEALAMVSLGAVLNVINDIEGANSQTKARLFMIKLFARALSPLAEFAEANIDIPKT